MELFTFARSERLLRAYLNLPRPHITAWNLVGAPNALDDREFYLAKLSFVRICYHTVGGAQERVEIHLIAHPDDDQTEARGRLTEQFATFDAGKAQCFLASDREHLLAVIEAGFGDFYDFNCVARSRRSADLQGAAPGI